MDPKKHQLTIVADLLNTLRPASPGMYLLYAYYHDIHCLHCNLAPKDAIPIALLRSDAINIGISSKLWNEIDAKIQILIRQGVLEWQTQKP